MVQITDANAEKHIREFLDSSYEGGKRLFVLPYDNKASNNQVSVESFKKYFLPRNFYDQPINDSIEQYDEVRKVSTGQ